MNAQLFFWLRIVLNDYSDVVDVPAFAVNTMLVCQSTARISYFSEDRKVVFDWFFYNGGAVTSNPDTTGGQYVIIEKNNAVFSDGAERCTEYAEYSGGTGGGN